MGQVPCFIILDGAGLPGEKVSPEVLEQGMAGTEKVAVYTVINDELEYASYQQYVESFMDKFYADSGI